MVWRGAVGGGKCEEERQEVGESEQCAVRKVRGGNNRVGTAHLKVSAFKTTIILFGIRALQCRPQPCCITAFLELEPFVLTKWAESWLLIPLGESQTLHVCFVLFILKQHCVVFPP